MVNYAFLSAFPPTESAVAAYCVALISHLDDPAAGEHCGVVPVVDGSQPRSTQDRAVRLVPCEPFGALRAANALNRFAIGDRDKLKFNADGSLDIFIQHDRPDTESNWLPAPKSGQLGLTLRLYAPKADAINCVWNPPAIKRVN